MKLQDDGAGKKLYCFFLEREIKEFGPKDVQTEVAPPSGAVIEGKNPEKKETCGSQGWCPGGKIPQAKVECEDKGGGGAGKVNHEPKRIQKDPSFHTGRSTLRPVEYRRSFPNNSLENRQNNWSNLFSQPLCLSHTLLHCPELFQNQPSFRYRCVNPKIHF